MFRNKEKLLRMENKMLQERLDAMEERIHNLEQCNRYGGGVKDEDAQLRDGQEKLRIKLWHMGYEYDRLFSEIELEKAEKIMPGNQKKLEELKDKFNGEQCFIIGNGPSLTATDLELIKGRKSFACNKITEIYYKTEWRPDFYLCTDELTYSGRVSKFSEDQKRVFLPVDFIPYLNQIKENMIFYPFFRRYCVIPEFSANPIRGVYDGGTVLYIAVQFAIYMGFKELVLLGVDSDYKMICTESGRKVFDMSNAHFYENDEEDFKAWEKINAWMDFNDTLHSGIYNIQDGWGMLRYQSEQLGIKVINATRGGALELFPRKELESLI